MKVSTILDQIDLGSLALPNFQRGYVWNRDQVRNLMRSLYKKHPVGSLLVWETNTSNIKARGDGLPSSKTIKLLLDGQQRVTSLYGIVRAKPPKFFDGNPQAFTGLYFNLDEEIFEFYAPMKMKDNPLWINISDLMKNGVGQFITILNEIEEYRPRLGQYINRLTAITNVLDTELHIEEVTGEDKTVDIVVDIFNVVNSGGTKLSKGDLALAKICAEWPEARDEMKKRLSKWKEKGFYFKLEWFLRNINAIITGEALFTALKGIDKETFEKGLSESENIIDYILNLIATRLGFDHDRVLGSRYSFPVLARYIMKRGGRIDDSIQRDRLLYWYIHTFLWGRFAGSTESALNKDLHSIDSAENPLDQLVNELRQDRGDLTINSNDFAGWSLGARFYPVLYMLTRACHAKDWDTGVELSSHLLGRLSGLELHHIFPKAQLKGKYTQPEVNAIANFTFLTKETNLKVSDKLPEEYLAEFAEKHPGAIESHWIPMDRDLWKIGKYREFLDARRELLAKATNDFLNNLVSGTSIIPDIESSFTSTDQAAIQIPGSIESDDEMERLIQCNDWVHQQGLPDGEFQYELSDPATNEPIAILDLAWPNGLQEGLSQPVALLLNEGLDTIEAANSAGYRYYTDIDSIKAYIKKEILAEENVVM
ncbi:DUF262 domain-containing protein [Chloroflexota bacterium]